MASSALRLYIAFVVITVLPIMVFSGYADHVLGGNAERYAQAENVQIAHISATLVEEHFRQNTTLLRSVAADRDFLLAWKKQDLKVIEDHLEEAQRLQPDSELVSSYSLDGTMNAIAPAAPTVIGQNFAYRDWYKGLLRGWQPYVSEVYRPRAAKQKLAVAISVPITDTDGHPIGIIAAAYSLEHISRWLRPTSAHGAQHISVVDQQGRLLAGPDIDVFKPAVELGSYEPVRDVMMGSSGTGLFRRGGEDFYVAYVPIASLHWGIIVEQSAAVAQHVRAETRSRTLLLSAVLILLSIGSAWLIGRMYRTQQQLSQQINSLAASEARYRSLIEGATLGIYRSNARGFISANPAMVKMLGYLSEAEVLRLDPERDIYADPNLRRKLIEEYRVSQQLSNVEVQWKRKDGKLLTVRLSGRSVETSPGEENEFEMIAEDVTERQNLEQQLRQAQKMEAVGRLAGGIAHDFNNLLTVIGGFGELIAESLEAEHPAKRQVEEVRRATERATTLTRQLLAFSRRQVLEPKFIDLNTVVAGMETLLRRLLGEDIELVTHRALGLEMVKADPGQIGQVIMNLALNARDAMPRGGNLTIETANTVVDESYASEHMAITPGDYVMLAVSDTGTGMDETTKSRVFEPFFTTKAAGEGTGLGLSTVYGIVKQSGGFVWVYSEIGIGTTFKVYLPKSRAEETKVVAEGQRKPQARGAERILVVEDEDAVRTLAATLLRRAGYQVLEAGDHDGALAALKVATEAKQAVQLLLTDVVLKQMSGRDLAEKVVTLSPSTRVLYMSGYTDDAVLRHGVLAASAAFLQKPFTSESLTTKVREVLDASATRTAGV